jgi:AcrR family transcriptional regulator
MEQSVVTAASGAPVDGRRRMSAEEIAQAALALLHREGLGSLSMRRLAEELGIGTMTLYGYFRNKRELLDAVIDAAAEDFVPPPRRGGHRTRLEAYMRATREWLLRHPALVQIRGTEPIVRPSAFRVSEIGMQLLLGAGLEPDEAARAFRVLFDYVFGTVAFSGAEPTAEQRRAIEAAVLTLPPDEFPALRAAVASAGPALGGSEQFEYGVARLLDGLDIR